MRLHAQPRANHSHESNSAERCRQCHRRRRVVHRQSQQSPILISTTSFESLALASISSSNARQKRCCHRSPHTTPAQPLRCSFKITDLFARSLSLLGKKSLFILIPSLIQRTRKTNTKAHPHPIHFKIIMFRTSLATPGPLSYLKRKERPYCAPFRISKTSSTAPPAPISQIEATLAARTVSNFKHE